MLNKGKIKSYSANLLLAALSISVTLVIMEGISRVIFDPIDYLKPYLVFDDALHHKIVPNTGGHDSWGFRNESVPATADIVAIGDSFTYGARATVNNSWPEALQQLTDLNVYNLGLGSYNAVQYYYLLENKALELDPSLVIIGFYYGNDLKGAYNLVYRWEYWEELRSPDIPADLRSRPDPKIYDEIVYNNWFAHHSILYRQIESSPLGNMARSLEAALGWRGANAEDITHLEDAEHNINTTFVPKERLIGLDLNDSGIQEGLRITLERFHRMNELSEEKGVNLLILLIPTKERVFAPYIENNKVLNNSQIIDELIYKE